MLLQSWGNKIRFFPAVPSKWRSIVFHKWLAEGGFEVSAKLSLGKIDFISIKSLTDSPCTIKADLKNFRATINEKKVLPKQLTNDTFRFELKKNDRLQITTSSLKKITIAEAN